MAEQRPKILLLGSGLMAESVVRHLLLRPQNLIHIASNIEADAKSLAEKCGLDRCSYSLVNVNERESLVPLVKNSDLVISYVPAFLHVPIARVCLEVGKHLVTASYVSAEMKLLDSQSKAKGLVFLNELGLDPGIDHLATMKIVDEIKQQGGKIVEYESWCGGLPSPGFCDNPLGYKFTWSPIGAFRALRNKAVYICDSKQFHVEAEQLLYTATTIQINQALSLEGYPNRDSLSYKDIYGLVDATKVLRGTLRYRGFCEIINAFKRVGLFDESAVTGEHWLGYITSLLSGEIGETIEQKIVHRCIDTVPYYEGKSEKQRSSSAASIIRAFKFFRLLSTESKFADPKLSNLQNLIKQLQPALNLKKGETDLIAMQHRFIIELNGKRFLRKSSLIEIGQKNGLSAMSLTVGMPTAIGAQLILDNKISERGVLRPIYPDIYHPCIEELAKHGIKLVELDEDL